MKRIQRHAMPDGYLVTTEWETDDMIPDYTVNGCHWTYYDHRDGQSASPCVQLGTVPLCNDKHWIVVCRWHVAVARRNGYHDE